jgi:LPPG:FO 2-phospho-L-lactate transferase
VHLLPMTDSEVDTIVTVRDTAGERRMHFQEWWTRWRASLEPVRFENPGMAEARPAPGVERAIAAADVVLLAPSNPVVSIGPILAVPGVREALASTPAAVVGVSPVIGGRVVRGMADVCLRAIGVDSTAAAIAGHYGARARGGVLDGWLLGEEDAALALEVDGVGIRAVVAPLWMRDAPTSTALARAALAAANT